MVSRSRAADCLLRLLSQANVEMMLEYLPLSHFKAIYVVDLCASLCKQARLRVQAKGWANVHVIEGDACTFAPPMQATAVTFSYSLSSAPPPPPQSHHAYMH
jgi:betaine lipid synthase